jgi:MtfA peptidase
VVAAHRVAHRTVATTRISGTRFLTVPESTFGWSFYRVAGATARVPSTRGPRQTEPVQRVDDLLRRHRPALAVLYGPVELERWSEHAHRLVERVSWEPARGLDADGEAVADMAATVAAHAALLVAGFSPATQPFRDITSVVLHRGTIVSREPRPGPVTGVMTNAPQHLAGQAGHGRGPVLLDWRSVQRDVARPELGVNVVYHEFAHKLDQLDGVFDGVPPLGSDRARAEWEQTFGTNYRRLERRGSDPIVRAYGATNPAEYFAVTSELFFTVPVALRAQHPRVYARLAEFYVQDPAALVVAHRGTAQLPS